MPETWITLTECPNYAVSNQGRVKRISPARGSRPGQIIKPHLHRFGYYYVSLSQNDRRITRRVNRLVCEAFHGPAPAPDWQAAHIDGDRRNNAASNLRWATRDENEKDKDRHGSRVCGENHRNSKLTADTVLKIRADSRPHKSIASEFGVSVSLISQVKRRVVWHHV